jgi:phospholipid/cholesterol/gamma-HCH transport system substrate-binding protein
MKLTTRRKNIISGLVALNLLFTGIIVGVESSFGAFDDTYLVKAGFDAAGQGLAKGSDVKLRGVNVGSVDKVELDGNQAVVYMDIKTHDKLPRTAELTVRPKTLFGEKFVDITPGEGESATDPAAFYPHSGTVEFTGKTTGGFELERVLTSAYPLLKDISPTDLMTVLNTLADAGSGLGPAINRQIINGQKLADVFAAHDADQREFLNDLDTLATQLGVRSDDLVALAKSLDTALPTINSRADALNTLLTQTARLSNDVSDLLETNTGFITTTFNQGQQVLNTLDAQRGQIIPLVQALASYTQWLAEVIRIPLGDGTYMAAVRGLLGTQTCLLGLCSGGNTISAVAPSATGGTASATSTSAAAAPADPSVVGAVLSFLGQLGGPK